MSYPERNICAFKGSSVNISCLYERWETTSVSWIRSKLGQVQRNVYLGGRFQVKNNGGKASILLIQHLNEADSAGYHCQPSRSSTWTSRIPGTTLTVAGREEPQQGLIILVLRVCFRWMLKSAGSSPSAGSVSMVTEPDLQVQVIRSPTGPRLVCHSSCLQDRFPFTWYQNGVLVPEETSASHQEPVWPETRYSCGSLQYRSGPVCEFISFSTAAIICRNSPTCEVLLFQMLRQMPR